MDNDNWDVLDPPRSKLRALAATLQQQISGLEGALKVSPAAANAQVLSVTNAWIALAGALDFGVEPALRACPNCKRKVPCEATRCRYCMATSPAAAKVVAP